ncbi:MAG: DUF2914 domain-containing protein [Patescibacteria group bacterium]
MRELVHTIKAKWERYERHISSITLLTGFVFDNLTLRRVDQLYDMLVLTSYVILAGLCIVGLSVLDRRRERGETHEDWHFWLMLTLQFAFGGLFSAFFIFYTRSGSFASSWPFFLVLAGLLIGNEIFKARYAILIFRITIYFFILFSFAALYIPIFLREIGDEIFFMSGLVSLVVLWGFLHLLRYLLPKAIYNSRKKIMASIGGIYLLLNILYFTNIIPPIPLALKEAGVYHSLSRTGSDYVVTGEVRHWYSFLRRNVYHAVSGEPVYVVGSVFAPNDLKTTIVHEWQFHDEVEDTWITVNRVAFEIVGGRDNGYRGYSVKSNATPGLWRVNIETQRGQLIGRTTFRIETVSTHPPLETKTIL